MDGLQLEQLRNAIEEFPKISRALAELGIDAKYLGVNDMVIVLETLLIVKAADDLARLLNINYIDSEIELIKQFDRIYIDESYFHTYDHSIGAESIHFFLALVKMNVKNAELLFVFRDKTFMSLQYLNMLPVMFQEFSSHDWTEGKHADPKSTYIMYDANTGYHKIGRAKDPHFRERTLLSVKPTISLIAYCTQDIERELHNTFRSKRIRGEWFNLSEREIKNICDKYPFVKV